ncbi:MAG: HD domain-containing phosphohydrolase [Planctomycetaceae bacterium]|jgi:putative two-component system response regulator
MSTDTQADPRSALAQLRSTIASLGAIRHAPIHNGDAAVAGQFEHKGSTSAAVAEPNLEQDKKIELNTTDESDSAGSPVVSFQPSPSRVFELPPEFIEPDEESSVADEPVRETEPVSPSPEPGLTEHQESVVIRQANKDARIMLVDDEPLNVMTFRQHLKQEGYSDFITTSNAVEALAMVRGENPDVVLLDINMPQVSGLDILRVMGLDPGLQHIPVLVLTATTDPAIRKKALDLGASDFLTKPVDPNELLPRVRNALILKQHFDMVSGETARLEQQVERRTRQLEATRQQLILSLARAAEHRDNDTGNHVLRVGRYSAIVAAELGYPEKRLLMLEQAAQLHDVGKIGIPDSILFKPGKLDPDEYELIKKHCALGKQIIEPISEKDFAILKTHTRRGESLLHVRSSPLLMLAARIAQTHHEKWDGTGYPLGLSGNDIPLEGRIVAVADVFDALSSARPYKKPFSRVQCFEILKSGRGQHFDPCVLDAFFARSEEIIDTQLLLMDEEHRVTGEEFTVDGPAEPSA